MAATNFSNITTFTGFLAEANNQTSGYFWPGINIMFFLVMLITLTTGFGWEAAVFSSGFAFIVSSIFLTYLGLQAMWITGIIIGLMLLLFIYMMWSKTYD